MSIIPQCSQRRDSDQDVQDIRRLEMATSNLPETDRGGRRVAQSLESKGTQSQVLSGLIVQIYASDRAHRMPVITPAYPSMCSTHNVTRSTLEVITSEFARAADISEKIMKGKLPWSALFVKHEFFLRYKYYLAITAASKSPETKVKWYSLCFDS